MAKVEKDFVIYYEPKENSYDDWKPNPLKFWLPELVKDDRAGRLPQLRKQYIR